MTEIHGRDGNIIHDGHYVARGAAWSMKIERDYVDVTAFNSEQRTYLRAQQGISGTFSGPYDPLIHDPSLTPSTNLVLWLPKPEPWRTLSRIFRRDTDYPLVSGDAVLETRIQAEPGQETTVEGEFTFGSSVWMRPYISPIGRVKNAIREGIERLRDALTPAPPPEPERQITGSYWCDTCQDNHEIYEGEEDMLE